MCECVCEYARALSPFSPSILSLAIVTDFIVRCVWRHKLDALSSSDSNGNNNKRALHLIKYYNDTFKHPILQSSMKKDVIKFPFAWITATYCKRQQEKNAHAKKVDREKMKWTKEKKRKWQRIPCENVKSETTTSKKANKRIEKNYSKQKLYECKAKKKQKKKEIENKT